MKVVPSAIILSQSRLLDGHIVAVRMESWAVLWYESIDRRALDPGSNGAEMLGRRESFSMDVHQAADRDGVTGPLIFSCRISDPPEWWPCRIWWVFSPATRNCCFKSFRSQE